MAAVSARFQYPQGIAVDKNGIVYVSGKDNHTIRRIDRGGAVTTFAGVAGQAGSADGAASVARFNLPMGIAVDRHDNIFVADWGNCTVRLIKPTGVVSTLAGVAGQEGSADGPGAEARFMKPRGIAVDCAGRVYVCDWGNHTLRCISTTGHVTTVAGAAWLEGSVDGWGTAARFDPTGLTVKANGSLYMGGGSVIRSVR